MNEVEHDLRELFEDKARDARTAPAAPPAVLRRGRRRQVGTVAIGAATALLVVVASIGILRAVGSGDSKATPAALNDLEERSATIQNFALTAPAGWTLIDWWPISSYLAVSASGSGSTTVPVPSPVSGGNAVGSTTTHTAMGSDTTNTSLADVVPVLQASTFDPGLDATLWCGSGGEIGSDDALLYVAVDATAMRSGDALPPPWPVPLEDSDTAAGGPCGPGAYARFSLGGVPYFAFARFGSDVTDALHQQLLDVFHGIQAEDAAPPVPAGMTPGYVVAAGDVDGAPWRLELGQYIPTPFTNGLPSASVSLTTLVWASVVKGSEELRGRVPLVTPIPTTVTAAVCCHSASMFPLGSEGVIAGRSAPGAVDVEYVAPSGVQTPLTLLDIPPSLVASAATQSLSPPSRTFWGLGDPSGGKIVQLAADGTELLRQEVSVLGSASGGSNVASPAQLPYEISTAGWVTARGNFQGTPWKVEQLYYKDGIRLTIGGTSEDLGALRLDEPVVRAVDRSGYGALVLVLTNLEVNQVSLRSEGSWGGRWMPSSTGDGAEARLWVMEVPGAGSGTLELDGRSTGTVSWP